MTKTDKDDNRRAPVQGFGNFYLPEDHLARKPNAKPAGTIAWSEHEEAWRVYAKRYGTSQSAERIAERSGFSYDELLDFLEREPTTWKPRKRKDEP